MALLFLNVPKSTGTLSPVMEFLGRTLVDEGICRVRKVQEGIMLISFYL